MSVATNVLPPMSFPGDNHGNFDGTRFMNEAQSSSSSQSVSNSTMYQEHSSSEDNRLKDQMHENIPTHQGPPPEQQHQAIPQQYQFQGPMPLQLKYNFRPGQKPSFQAAGDPDFDGRKLRRTTMRKTVDYNSSIIKELENRLWQRDYRDREHLQPDVLYIPHVLPPPSYRENPFNAVTTRFVKTATNKVRCPVFCLAWTPEGRRLITGTSSGEFTLWNGLTFNFETILQAHDCPVRTMVWSNNEQWMLTGDHSGFIKYWQSNMNNVKMYQGHREAVRGISFSPTDNKFVSCSDDGTVRLWDFITCNEERIFRGHGADVKCVSWHPYKSLVASGSKDNQQPVKLWDPRSGKSMATIHAHKATVMDIKWNQNGNWVATASRDHLIKLYDIRNLGTDMQVFRGHKKETSVIAWHPQHEGLMCSGGSDGSILFWHVGTPKEVASIDQAHDSIVWALAWHPLGHILCSGSNDHSCKFWTRNYPGDPMRDKYNLNTIPQSILGFEEYEDESGTVRIPGMGPEDKVDASKLPDNIMSSIPGLDSGIFKDKSKPQKKVPYAKPIPKNFQAQWNSELRFKDSNFDENFVPDPKMMAAKLFEHAPGAVSVKSLKVDALYIYGKTVPVKENSELSKVVSEGRDRIIEYVNNGNIPDLNSMIPHTDPNETSRRNRMQYLMRTRGRQFNDAVNSLLNQMKKSDRSLKRSKDTNAPVPSKKWRGSDRESSAPYSSSKYSQYNESSDYRDRPSTKGGRHNDNYNYDNYNENYDYDDYEYEDGEEGYSDKRNYSKDNWEDDDYQFPKGSDRRGGWNKGSHQESEYPDSGKGFKSNRSQAQSDDYYESRSSSRFSGSGRKERSSRGRRGSGSSYPRRPYRGSGGSSSGAGSRQPEHATWEDDDEYYEERDYDRNENNDNYDNYYEDYSEENGNNYGGSSRGGRYPGSRGRGESRGRGSFSRGRGSSSGGGSGSSSSWRGGRGKEAPRRSRGRGSRRGS